MLLGMPVGMILGVLGDVPLGGEDVPGGGGILFAAGTPEVETPEGGIDVPLGVGVGIAGIEPFVVFCGVFPYGFTGPLGPFVLYGPMFPGGGPPIGVFPYGLFPVRL